MMRNIAVLLLLAQLSTPAISAGIFNTTPVQPQPVPPAVNYAPAPAPGSLPAPIGQSGARAPTTTYQPVTPPQASVVPPMKADPKVMAQFDRFPNEPDEPYLARMKVISDRAVAELERVGKASIEKMQSLAPPPLR